MYGALITYHTNPFTCGVARFNHSLAAALGCPLVSLTSALSAPLRSKVLFSIKLEEMNLESQTHLGEIIRSGQLDYDLLLHGLTESPLESRLCQGARHVFAASAEMASRLMAIRSDVVSVYAPGAAVLPRSEPVDCKLLTFGMAHKIRSEGYQRLAKLLKSDVRTFQLEISTALHEGGTFDESFFTVGKEISASFDGNVRFLGFLADAEVSERLRTVDALIAFFPRGVRENNTTVLSAMTHGCPVITNLDAFTPTWMVHAETVFDVSALSEFPSKEELRRVGDEGMRVASRYDFTTLAKIILSS